MVKKSNYCSSLLLHKVEVAALSGLWLYSSNKTLLLQLLLFGWRCQRLSNDDHHCGLSHTSRFHSMHSSFGDGASLAGSSRERSDVLLRSSWGNVFGGHIEGDVFRTWKSWFSRKRWEVQIVPSSVPKFVITKMWTNKICIDIKELSYNV